MPRYGINPFSGEIAPINNPSGDNDAGTNGDRYAIFKQDVPAKEWIIQSQWAYATPTIYVSQRGEEIFEKEQQVAAQWAHAKGNPYEIRVTFELYPYAGYVILHRN